MQRKLLLQPHLLHAIRGRAAHVGAIPHPKKYSSTQADNPHNRSESNCDHNRQFASHASTKSISSFNDFNEDWVGLKNRSSTKQEQQQQQQHAQQQFAQHHQQKVQVVHPIQNYAKTVPRKTQTLSKPPRIGRLILVRHGQSVWNVTDETQNTVSRFTGWADVKLTHLGMDQARSVGKTLDQAYVKDGEKLRIDAAYCSLLRRSRETLDLLLNEMEFNNSNGILNGAANGAIPRVIKEDLEQILRKAEEEEMSIPNEQKPTNILRSTGRGSPSRRNSSTSSSSTTAFLQGTNYPIPVISSWRLNERHYGGLVGMSKDGAEQYFRPEMLQKWRHGWDDKPPPMESWMRTRWNFAEHCQPITHVKYPHDTPVKRRDKEVVMPSSESLCDTCQRVLPLWTNKIVPRVQRGENVLVVAHANTIRALLFHLDPDYVTRKTLKKIKIPSAKPLVYTFRSNLANERQNGENCNKDKKVVLQGGLVLLPNHLEKSQTHNTGLTIGDDNQLQLSGEWIESDDIKRFSFCTSTGQEKLEHEIA